MHTGCAGGNYAELEWTEQKARDTNKKRSVCELEYMRNWNKNNMLGCMAVSLAGHDRNKIYVIVGEEEEYVYLADGRGKTCRNPKKKNRKHIQIIKKYRDSGVAEKLLRGESIDVSIIIQEVKACQKQM